MYSGGGELEPLDAGDSERLSGVRGLSEPSDKLCRSSLGTVLYISSDRNLLAAEKRRGHDKYYNVFDETRRRFYK